MLSNASQGYSHPDVTQTRSDTLNLNVKRELGPRDSVEGNVYYRNIWREIGNSNVADPVVAGSANQLAGCLALYGSACAGNVVSGYTQDIYGLNLQFSSQEPLAGRPQYFSAGFNGEYGGTSFAQSTQDAVLDARLVAVGVGAFRPQSRIGSGNLSLGFYATETVLLSTRASLTLSARLDRSRVALDGSSVDVFGNAVRVDGSHSYRRLNPALGGTFALTPATTLFANYAEGFRTPSAIELACADAAHPCAGVPSAFSADPPLQGVSAKSFEAGARGRLGNAAAWRLALFHSDLDNDILFHQSTLTTGYFSNVGTTRRAGLEASIDARHGRVDYALAATVLEASYRSAFEVANGANAGSACPGSSCVPVRPGDRIPGMPRVNGKLAIGYQATARSRLELRLQAQGSIYARGDENNLATHGRIPGFATAQAGWEFKINRTLDLDLSVANLFDRRYATFGMLAANNLRGGAPENFWGVAPPLTVYVSLKAAF
jgi:outer membrane receptor protein involved in Fe transport